MHIWQKSSASAARKTCVQLVKLVRLIRACKAHAASKACKSLQSFSCALLCALQIYAMVRKKYSHCMNIIAISKKTYFLRFEGRWRMLEVRWNIGGMKDAGRLGDRFWRTPRYLTGFCAIAGGRGTSWHFKRGVPPQWRLGGWVYRKLPCY